MQGVEGFRPTTDFRFTVRDGVDEDKKLPGSRFVAPYSDGHNSLFRGDMEHSEGADLVDP